MLNPTQKDIQELQKEFEDDARERAKEIALSEKLDNELLKKREAGEIGVSHGTDNYVSFLMIGHCQHLFTNQFWLSSIGNPDTDGTTDSWILVGPVCDGLTDEF